MPQRKVHPLCGSDIFQLFCFRCPLKLNTTKERSDIVDGVATPSSGLEEVRRQFSIKCQSTRVDTKACQLDKGASRIVDTLRLVDILKK